MLLDYLLEKEIVTGPLEKNTSHSRMDNMRKMLLGMQLFKGGEHFLTFGSALHEVFLENIKTTFKTLSRPDKNKIVAMVNALNAHPVVRSLMKDSIREQKIYGHLFGCYLALILDAKQPKLNRGFDLKTTMCKTKKDFEAKVVENGYVKQGLIYKKVTKLKDFYFVAICKEPPHPIFIIDMKDYKKEEKYAEQELKFLTYFYNKYGNINQLAA